MPEQVDMPTSAHIAGVGPRLKATRESAGLSLAQMADQTKIPARMLTLIEAGDFAALPARTYATGFTRTYARVLGLDEKAMVAAVRAELGMHEQVESRTAHDFEPGDPARVPSARFAWLAAVAALAVVAAGMVLWRTYYAPAVVLPSLLPDEAASAAPPTAAPPLAAPIPVASPTEVLSEAATAAATAPAVVAAPQRAMAAPRRNVSRISAPAAPVGQPPLEAPASPVAASTGQN